MQLQAIHKAVILKENELKQAKAKLTAVRDHEHLLGKVGQRPECPYRELCEPLFNVAYNYSH